MHYKSCKRLLPKKHIAGSLDLAALTWQLIGNIRFLVQFSALSEKQRVKRGFCGCEKGHIYIQLLDS